MSGSLSETFLTGDISYVFYCDSKGGLLRIVDNDPSKGYCWVDVNDYVRGGIRSPYHLNEMERLLFMSIYMGEDDEDSALDTPSRRLFTDIIGYIEPFASSVWLIPHRISDNRKFIEPDYINGVRL